MNHFCKHYLWTLWLLYSATAIVVGLSFFTEFHVYKDGSGAIILHVYPGMVVVRYEKYSTPPFFVVITEESF